MWYAEASLLQCIFPMPVGPGPGFSIFNERS